MTYSREIEDSVLIQLIILFALQKSGRSITQSQLADLVLGNCNITFINYRSAIVHLIEINHIIDFTTTGDIPMYEITDEGIQSIEFFITKIPVYIREPIEKAIIPMFRLEEQKKSIIAELLPLNENEFMADCSIYDCGKPLMKLSFYAGTRETALEMMQNFKVSPEKVYQAVLNSLVSEDIDSSGDISK